mmetsp:Transcript_4767/g.6022  ORF Transcript_4767/g.6022 Transcript_4767/m.6022 type:complete len:156 (-) Transcript_4767:2925-3392(-)
MGFFRKKKKKEEDYDDDDEEGPKGDLGGGDDGPSGGGGGGPSFGGSDDNPYQDDPAYKQLKQVLESNGLVRHRRAFIRNSIYTVDQAQKCDDKRLEEVGVFLKSDRQKLLRIFKDTKPVESTVDAQKAEEKEKEKERKEKERPQVCFVCIVFYYG